MLLVLLSLGILKLSQARIIDQKCTEEILKGDLDSPYQLAIDYDTNNLFFSNTVNGSYTFVSTHINLKTNEMTIIPNVPGGFANAVDNSHRVVYLGGSEGIYRYNYETKTAKIITDTSMFNIWQLYVKDKLYFTTFPNEELYVYKNGEATRMPELIGASVNLVAVDNSHTIYFSNSSGLYSFQKNSNTLEFKGAYTINGFTADINGNLFFSTSTGIFKIEENGDITKFYTYIRSNNTIYGVAVESDGTVIFANSNSIIRLTPAGVICDEQNDDKKFVNDVSQKI